MSEREKILIVDDEPVNLEFFTVMLSKLGFDVEQAESGEEALEKVKNYIPDLIILDNIMPGLTGWEVTKKLKNEKEYIKAKDVPIIMFSAMDAVEDKIEGFELGVEDYITKPFNFSEVLARIRAVLRSRALSKQVHRRERRIAAIESLNNSLILSTRHMRGTISQMLKTANELNYKEEDKINEFINLFKKDGTEIIRKADDLENKIEEIKSQENRFKGDDLVIDNLENKFKKHLIKNTMK